MVHFNWTQLIPGIDHHYIHVATAAIVGALLIGVALVARIQLPSLASASAPAGRFSVRGVFEAILEFNIGIIDTVVGSHGRKFAPMLCGIFLFIFINNIVGLLPGMTPATDNINTNLAIGLFSFAVYNFYGFKEHGFVNYMKHFMGPIWWMAPFMLVLELISHCVRPLSLSLRLMGNMLGDHTVLSIFLDITPYIVPIAFYGLGLFVCFLQAYVFTLLSAVYVALATAHDH